MQEVVKSKTYRADGILETKGRADVAAPVPRSTVGKFLLRPPTKWMRATQIMKSSILYSKSADKLNFNLI